jgi:hypothetical protein
MPGPVSDSYDPEFGTAANAEAVATEIQYARNLITQLVFGGDEKLKNIIQIVHGKSGEMTSMRLSEKQWRVIRFALNRALESL